MRALQLSTDDNTLTAALVPVPTTAPAADHPEVGSGGFFSVDLLPGRMAAKVRVTASGCWEWTGALQSRGYGCAGIGQGRTGLAHRLAYLALVGPIPDGLQIDHLCRNKTCCNPAHLEPVTGSENQRRAKSLITACPKGHDYSDANTIVRRGRRECRTCARDYKRAWDHRQRAA